MTDNKDKRVIFVIGPTAVGKTMYSIELAKSIDGEIVSCDSMQLYLHMDIGSAKPSKEDIETVPHHLIDIVEPWKEFSVAMYQKIAKKTIIDIFSRGKTPIVVGGTGLYINSLVYDMNFGTLPVQRGYRRELERLTDEKGKEHLYNRLKSIDPHSAQRIHPNNFKRVIRALEVAEVGGRYLGDFSSVQKTTEDYKPFMICLSRDRQELYDKINQRVDHLMEAGLSEEVKNLMKMGLSLNHTSMQGIGYKELIKHFDGLYDIQTAVDEIKKNTRHYAKRQITWFKRYKDMKWFELNTYSSRQEAIGDLLKWVRENR